MTLSHGAKFRDIHSSNFRSDGKGSGVIFGGKHQGKTCFSHSSPFCHTVSPCQDTMLLVPALQKTAHASNRTGGDISFNKKMFQKKQIQLPFNVLRMFLFRQIELIFVGRFFVEDWNVRLGDFNSPIASFFQPRKAGITSPQKRKLHDGWFTMTKSPASKKKVKDIFQSPFFRGFQKFFSRWISMRLPVYFKSW